MKVGKILRIARIICEMSQTKVSEEIGVARSYLCMIEKDERPINTDLLEKYADTLETTPSRIIALAEIYEEGKMTEIDLRKEVVKRLW